MYDTLWLGCSHSSGSYCKTTGELIDRNHSIPTVLASKFEQYWKSISFPGDGVMRYAETIKLLDDLGYLSEFRNVIIQRTYEPRMTFYKDSDCIYERIAEYTQDPIRFETITPTQSPAERTFSLFANQNYDAYVDKFTGKELELADMWYDIATSVDPREQTDSTMQYPSLWVDVMYDYIRNTVAKNNCNYYYFDYVGSYRNHITRLGKAFKDTLINGDRDFMHYYIDTPGKTDLLATAQHPTHGAVDYLVDILYGELNNAGYK